MALVRAQAGTALAAALLAGCAGTGTGTQQARDENRKMDCLIRCGQELERGATRPILVARSQSPEVLPPVRLGNPVPATAAPPAAPTSPMPTIDPTVPAPGIRLPENVPPAAPVTPVGGTAPAEAAPTDVPRLEGDAQVRIVASLGKNPIYESEVREAVYQRLHELHRLTGSQRAVREREIFREELRKIIERELVLDDMTAQLTARKQTAQLGKLRDAASKEADARLKEFKKEKGIPNDEEFRSALRSQGLTVAGIKRQIERMFMMQTYLRQVTSGKLENVGLADVREYYARHPEEFKAEDHVKWQDLFVLAEKFKSRAEARQYADSLAARATREDFAKLAAEFSMGDSKFRQGAGIGEKPGEIFPQELEPTILALNPGQVTVKETETGYHIIRVAERMRAGIKPYDEKLQGDIRRKLQNQLYDQEVRRLIDTLWRRAQPQIWIDG